MKTIPDLETHLFELIRRASTKLPADVTAALAAGQAREAAGSPAAATLATILENVELSAEAATPICQDTGTPVFYIKHPWDYPVRPIREAALAAVRRATRESLLRPNAVDSVTGANSNDNTGDAFPSFYFEQWEEADSVRFDLLLKGGGSENQSAQYSLPHGALKAGRDMEGVKRVILDALVNAQGQGCGPSVLGVCIGGDRATSYSLAKKQHLRPLADKSPDPLLAAMEEEITEKANALGVGPMGFGGATTVLATKITKAHRLPASFYVSISYLCWASRQAGMSVKGGRVAHD
jgi:fumarate hydratase class I